MYHKLDGTKIVETAVQLRNRIKERFPEANLGNVADDLVRLAEQAVVKAPENARPLLPLRLVMGVLVLACLGVLAWIFMHLKISLQVDRMTELFQGVDSALNTAILLGGAVFFLFTLEVRHKRNRALKLLHELRSLAHIVDMHQLTKDPDMILSLSPRTASSPQRRMTRFQLSRYLDYCSEMSSLIGKIAALYVQHYDDPVVLGAVDQLEDLTTGLSRKAWQKIMINQQLAGEPPAPEHRLEGMGSSATGSKGV